MWAKQRCSVAEVDLLPAAAVVAQRMNSGCSKESRRHFSTHPEPIAGTGPVRGRFDRSTSRLLVFAPEWFAFPSTGSKPGVQEHHCPSRHPANPILEYRSLSNLRD